MPPKIGAMRTTVSTISSTSLVARQIGKASISANCLKSAHLPSITGAAASGPMSPRPSTAVPSVTTATVLRLIVSWNAFEGSAAIASETGLPVQLGGGLRSAAAVDAAFAAGVSRAVLGTAAFSDPELLDGVLAAHGERIAVSIDVRGGMVSTAGWTQTGTLAATDAAAELSARGVRGFIYTDIDRDGMLGGPALNDIVRVTDAVEGEVIYSGGVGSLEDLEALASLRHPRLAGVIAGKALYEGRFTVAEGQEALCSFAV